MPDCTFVVVSQNCLSACCLRQAPLVSLKFLLFCTVVLDSFHHNLTRACKGGQARCITAGSV